MMHSLLSVPLLGKMLYLSKFLISIKIMFGGPGNWHSGSSVTGLTLSH